MKSRRLVLEKIDGKREGHIGSTFLIVNQIIATDFSDRSASTPDGEVASWTTKPAS
jgi:hypothetical protein